MQFGQVVPLESTAKEPTRRQLVEQKKEKITSKAAAYRGEKKPLTLEQMAAKDARLDVQVARVNTKLMAHEQLDPNQVKDIVKERKYDNVFYAILVQIERNAEKAKDTPEPYAYLATVRVAREPQLRTGRTFDPNREFSTPLPKRRQEQEQSPGMQVLQRSMKKLGTALAPKCRTQDVRSDVEKEQDWER